MAQPRNLELEKQAIGAFGKKTGKLPESSADWAQVHQIAYGADIPDELRSVTEASKASAGTPSSVAPTPITGTATQPVQPATNLEEVYNKAKDAYSSMMSPSMAMATFQEAAKAKVGNENQGLGTSDLYKAAGLTSFDSLHDSMASKESEIVNMYNQIQQAKADLSPVYSNKYDRISKEFEAASDLFKQQKSITADITKTLLQKSEELTQLQVADYLHKVNPDLFPAPARTGKVVGGYDISSYATDPLHEDKVSNILQNIGKMTDLSQVSSYIKSKYPTSPITAQMISQTSQKYGVPWEMLIAMMEQDSSLGTKGKATRTFNPGNVGNDDSGNLRNYGTWQAGVDAVGDWLARHKSTETSAPMSEAAKIAQDMFTGVSTMKLTDLPTTKRTAVSAELTRLKQEAIKQGDIAGIIKSSAGGKETDATFNTSLEKAFNVIGQVDELKRSIKKEETSPIMGIIRSNNPYDTKAQLIKAQLTALVPNLARGIYGEVGVLTDNDVELYAKTLPNLTSTKEVNELILGATIRSVQRSIENKLKVQAGLGRDVSGILSTYLEVKTKADEILGGNEINPSASSGVTPSGLKYTIEP